MNKSKQTGRMRHTNVDPQIAKDVTGLHESHASSHRRGIYGQDSHRFSNLHPLGPYNQRRITQWANDITRRARPPLCRILDGYVGATAEVKAVSRDVVLCNVKLSSMLCSHPTALRSLDAKWIHDEQNQAHH
jgi:hypothetical protein